MKVILDCKPQNMGQALNVVFRVQTQNPNQKTGTSNGVVVRASGIDFLVIKNQDSYTVKEKQ